MKPLYNLIVSYVHGNALGVILEPAGAREQYAEDELRKLWQVRIGVLVAEAAIGKEYPKEDFDKVVRDLVAFCKEHGIEP